MSQAQLFSPLFVPGFCETNITLKFMMKPHSHTAPQLSLLIETNYSLRTIIKASLGNHNWEIVNKKNSSTAKACSKLKGEFRLVKEPFSQLLC